MNQTIRIGTRESQLAVWQATQVKDLLSSQGFAAELVYIKSEGDIDLKTPLYEMGVQGIFTRSLDIALLNQRIDLAVHSMKDVPTQLPAGIVQAAVLERASYKDLLVVNQSAGSDLFTIDHSPFTIATSSIRRKAQWLHRYPNDIIENLRGNVNTRLQKVKDSHWRGAIFAAAGLERINLRPPNAIELDWMLPAPAQGAIVVACRDDDGYAYDACQAFHHEHTALCTKAERDFLRALLGGCSTPISALATIQDGQVQLEGNILSLNGQQKATVTQTAGIHNCDQLGIQAAHLLLQQGGQAIADSIRNDKP